MKARTQTEFAKKWVGIVDVFSKEKKARLTSLDVYKDDKVEVFPNNSKTLDIALDDLPKHVQRLIKPNMASKKFRVRLNEDGDNIEALGPVNGMYELRAIYLGPKKQDGSYSLVHKVYNEGTDKENSTDSFFCSYEFVDGPFKGMDTPAYWLRYKFEEIPEGEEDEGFTRFDTVDTPQASQLHKLQTWAEIHGNVLDEPIRWPDDGIILDTIEERVLNNDRTVNGIFENGYIKSVQAIETYDDDVTDEEIDNAFPEADDDDEPEVVEVPAKSKVSKKVASPSAKKSVAKGKSAKDDDDDL